MRIFDKDNKVNFVDKNNVFVGYDLSQNCCEYANWFISESKENKVHDEQYYEIKRKELNIEDYVFDTKFFEEVDSPDVEQGGMVRFRLIGNKKKLFLHLFNCHNGYYGHGFEFKINDKVIKEDYL